MSCPRPLRLFQVFRFLHRRNASGTSPARSACLLRDFNSTPGSVRRSERHSSANREGPVSRTSGRFTFTLLNTEAAKITFASVISCVSGPRFGKGMRN
jgi:hypothetical protein